MTSNRHEAIDARVWDELDALRAENAKLRDRLESCRVAMSSAGWPDDAISVLIPRDTSESPAESGNKEEQ